MVHIVSPKLRPCAGAVLVEYIQWLLFEHALLINTENLLYTQLRPSKIAKPCNWFNLLIKIQSWALLFCKKALTRGQIFRAPRWNLSPAIQCTLLLILLPFYFWEISPFSLSRSWIIACIELWCEPASESFRAKDLSCKVLFAKCLVEVIISLAISCCEDGCSVFYTFHVSNLFLIKFMNWNK